MTVYRPTDEKEDYTSRGELFADIVVSLGGRTAERLMLDDISTGASGDIQSATEKARSMVTRYGFSERLGPISFDSSDHSIFIGRDFGTTKSYSEETAAIIDEEVKRLFDEAGKRCEEILTEHKDLLIATAEYLIENESMEGETFAYICEHGGEFPPVKDDTIEPPAKVISYNNEPVGLPETETPAGTEGAAPAPEANAEENAGEKPEGEKKDPWWDKDK